MSESPEDVPQTTTPPATTSTPASTSSTTTSTSVPIPSLDPDEPEGHSMDDLLPGQSAEPSPSPSSSPPGPLVFVDLPQHIESQPGVSVLLACRTAEAVAECQWSWQPLTPTHLPLPNFEETTVSVGDAPTLTTFGKLNGKMNFNFSTSVGNLFFRI